MILAALKQRFGALARSERGIALPVTLFAMIAGMSLAGSAVMATVNVQDGAHRDKSSKGSIGAADAGASVAKARQNRYGFILNEKNPCLRVGTGGTLEKSGAELVAGQAWCPAVSGTVGDASYVYRVSPVGLQCGDFELCVVSTGTAGKVSRRIEVTFNRSGAFKSEQESSTWQEESKNIEETLTKELTEAQEQQNLQKITQIEEQLEKLRQEEAARAHLEGFVGREGISLSGNADIRVGVGTNGYLESSGNAAICGDIRYGVGKSWTKNGNAHQCSGYGVEEGNVELPSVSSFIPLNIATSNSDYRLVTCTRTGVPTGCQSDTLTSDKWGKNYPFNPTTRELNLSANATLTVGGGDYWLCSIKFSGNSELIVAKGAKVRFFFDTPEHCGGNGNQLQFSGNNRIAATGYQPSASQFELPGFYFLGSPNGTSQINLSGNASVTNELIIYGPDTYINISGNATWKGIIAGKRITMSGNGHVEQDAGFQVPPELNPKPGDKSESVVKLEEEIKVLQEGGVASTEEIEKKENELHEAEAKEASKTNRAPIYYTPQAYFECTSLPAPGQAPNASC